MSVDVPGSVAVSTMAPCGISTGLLPLPFPIVWRFAFHSIADDLSMEPLLLQTWLARFRVTKAAFAILVANVAGPPNIFTQTLRARVTQIWQNQDKDFFAGEIRPP